MLYGTFAGGLAEGLSGLAEMLARQKQQKQMLDAEAKRQQAQFAQAEKARQEQEQWEAGAPGREVAGMKTLADAYNQAVNQQPGGRDSFKEKDVMTGTEISPAGYDANKALQSGILHKIDPLGYEEQMSNAKAVATLNRMITGKDIDEQNREKLRKFDVQNPLPPRTPPRGPTKQKVFTPEQWQKQYDQHYQHSLNDISSPNYADPVKTKAETDAYMNEHWGPKPAPGASGSAVDDIIARIHAAHPDIQSKQQLRNYVRAAPEYKSNSAAFEEAMK